jgi:hypothetical protein
MPPFIDRRRRMLDTASPSAFETWDGGRASPEAAAAWERAMVDWEASGRGKRQRLNDQSRTAAFDPGLDLYDPGNARAVDFQGRSMRGPATDRGSWNDVPSTAIPPELKPQAKPATRISSGDRLTRVISDMIGRGQEPPPVSQMDFIGTNYPELGPSMPGYTPTPSSMPAFTPGIAPQIGPLEAPPSARGYTQAGPSIGDRWRELTTIPGLDAGVQSYIDKRNQVLGDVDRWGKSYSIRDWLGRQLGFAQGGPTPGYMRGGYPELYTQPVRQAFSTGGGQNYVGPDHTGAGNGRSDDIEARLSPREYVMDAETVALAGDGDPDAGARQFDRLRKNLRTHKGKALAKGKFSPEAKPIETYMSPKASAADKLAHSGVSEGIRRRRS